MQRAMFWISVSLAALGCGPAETPPERIEPGAAIVEPEAAPPVAIAEPEAAAEPEAVVEPEATAEPEAPAMADPDAVTGQAWAIEPIVHPIERGGVPAVEVPTPTQAPVYGGTLWVNPAGTVAVVSDPGHDRVFFVDLEQRRVRAHHWLVGAEPWRIIEHAGQIWISLRRAGQVARFDLASWALVERHPVCAAPRGLAYDARADLIRVACSGGDLVSLDPADGAEVERSYLAPDLRDVVVTDEHLLVSIFRAPELLVVRAGRIVDSWLPLQEFDELGALAFVPRVAWRAVAGPSGTVMLLHQRVPVGEVPTAGRGGYMGRPPRHRPPACRGRGMAHATVTQFLPDGFVRADALLQEERLAVDLAILDGGKLLVASGALAGAPLRRLGVYPPGPDGVVGCPSPEGTDDGQADSGTLAVAVDAAERRYAVVTNPLRLIRHTSDGDPIQVALPSGPDDPGRTLFHTHTPAQIACATCHPEGSDDGHVWRFELLGERRTQHLRGGLRGTEPFHWDGEFRSMRVLMEAVMVERMGHLDLQAGDSELMLDWLDGLPAAQATPRTDRAAAARGAALYADPTVGCTGCHGVDGQPVYYANVDVGTGGAFQVPPLKGIAGRPPYLHDGCAATLTDRFGACGGGDDHGQTSHLDDAQIADLVAFLRTL